MKTEKILKDLEGELLGKLYNINKSNCFASYNEGKQDGLIIALNEINKKLKDIRKC